MKMQDGRSKVLQQIEYIRNILDDYIEVIEKAETNAEIQISLLKLLIDLNEAYEEIRL